MCVRVVAASNARAFVDINELVFADDDDIAYHDLGGDYFARRSDPERMTRRLVAQLERLGHQVTLQTLPQAA